MKNQFNDYYSTLKISNNEKHQLLLSSQLYGTNFSVFGKFTYKEKNPTNKATIIKIDLKIFNYKGILDLGFSVNHTPTIEKKNDGTNDFLLIKFSLRAVVAGNSKVSRQIILTPTSPIEISEFVKTQRTLIPISGDINNSPITNGVFDSEFYYRDGAKFIRKIVREIPTDDEVSTYPVRVEDIPGSLFPPTNPGIICRQGTLHSKFA